MARRSRAKAPEPTSLPASKKTSGNPTQTPAPQRADQASSPSPPRWIPSREPKLFDVCINGGDPCLTVKYNPHELIVELEKLFGLLYFGTNNVPPSLLVKPDSPFAGLFTSWFTMGSTQAGKGKHRRATEEEINSLLNSIADGVYDRATSEFLEGLKQTAQVGSEENSRYSYSVGRLTTEATDYVAKYLHEKLQTALIQLAMEAQVHALQASFEAQGLKKVNTKSDQSLVDTILGTEEKQIKSRLRTRGPGGSGANYDFSSLPVLYEQGKNHFRKAKRLLKEVGDLPCGRAREVIKVGCGEIDLDLIDRMLDKQEYQSSLSHLAVEWAARRCGLPANRGGEYPPTYLLQVLSGRKRKKK